jgi:hypothetical protein
LIGEPNLAAALREAGYIANDRHIEYERAFH